MPLVRECLWASKAKGSFWGIFEKFPLVPPLHFFRKCGFWMTSQNLPSLGHSGTFGAADCAKMFSSVCTLNAYKLEDNAICTSVVLSLSNEGYFFGDFWKISLGPPFALFQKMRLLGYLAIIAITSPFGHFQSRCLRQNVFQSLPFKSIIITA